MVCINQSSKKEVGSLSYYKDTRRVQMLKLIELRKGEDLCCTLLVEKSWENTYVFSQQLPLSSWNVATDRFISNPFKEGFLGDAPNPGRGLAALCTPAPHGPSLASF